LKLRVRAILPYLSPSSLIVVPACLRCLDVVVLSPFRSSTQQDDDRFPIATEIHSIAWTEIDSVFEHAGADALGIREIALFQTRDRYRNFRGSLGIKSIEPN
jgi:hypothetical protein